MTSRMESRRPLRRFALKVPPPAAGDGVGQERAQHARHAGLLILSVLTVWAVAWLGYRWLIRPAWLASLPPLLDELVFLIETAGALALAFIWAGLGFRQWRRQRARAGMVSAEELYTSLSPTAFERYVAGLFRQKGYQVVVRGSSGDHGVDLEVRNGAGRRAIVQCKRYQNTVGEEIVRELMGTMLHERASHGFLVTTAEISESARAWAADKPITLIDGQTLAQIATVMKQRRAAAGEGR